ncbi:universal stress protein [Halogeometricum sp. S1BR25-6]|uniref:Universal stress protein n=1 Tax=Halogeometricum salsisoli TaxID=2950536 RepID=A0ABU2GJ11_9EURY|nr:universal stress protein [Halogeometricum sp. S1BR25-6]MDS0300144.1 universal stress protein [Halogeometricum sp. S1BR25-6]
MTRVLVTVERADRDRALLERAKALAVGAETDEDLLVVALATPEAYEEIEETLAVIGRAEHTTYAEDDVLDGVSADVEDTANDVLEPDVGYELRTIVAGVDEQAEALLGVANRTGCDHIFLPGYRRSPTKKAIFGDRAQRVILDFDGSVTVGMN